jgi:hypothetical protein
MIHSCGPKVMVLFLCDSQAFNRKPSLECSARNEKSKLSLLASLFQADWLQKWQEAWSSKTAGVTQCYLVTLSAEGPSVCMLLKVMRSIALNLWWYWLICLMNISTILPNECYRQCPPYTSLSCCWNCVWKYFSSFTMKKYQILKFDASYVN